MIGRGRLIAVVAIVATGALGIISSTQTWLTVVLADGAQHALAVPGAATIPVLAPLSVAVLALGAALAIAGLVLRYVFGVLAVAIGAVLAVLTWGVAAEPGTAHVASAVTTATGIAGSESISQLIESIAATAWPAVTLAGWIVLVAAAAFTLATAHRWRANERRYRTQPASRSSAAAAGSEAPAASRPHDAIDDWDDLSRGEDPTA